MNWKYILSLTPENLTDEEKDELYNSVTWVNVDEEDLNLKKCKALIKVSQKVLKYKGEQVETLLHELDDLATKQGEEDVRKLESDTDISKSRKSSSVEYENLEQKYIELKGKYKKQVKQNEKNSLELEKIRTKLKNLEVENQQLQQDLQNKTHDGSESDVSETVKDQNKELIGVVQNKNKQISDLLHDIEDVESENSILRNKLVKVRDELSTATEEITLMTEKLTSSDAKLAESQEKIKKLIAENEVLQEQMQGLQEEKHYMEQKMEEFTKEITARMDIWKETLHQKDQLIHDLKSKQIPSSIHSSISSLPNDELEKSNVIALNTILIEREKQINELQLQLKEATVEMEEITKVIQSLKIEKQSNSEKISEMLILNKDLKKQLKAAHERSQNLQHEVEHLEKVVNSKDNDLKDIIKTLKEKGHKDLAIKLQAMEDLKTDNRHQEKQIENLVRTCNKLQDGFDEVSKENEMLRNKLGIPEDEELKYPTYTRKPKHAKELQGLKKKLTKYEEENLELKSKIQKLNRNLAELSDKIINGDVDVTDTVEKDKKDYGLTKDETTAIIEENEALRKGMHEILNSINVKKEKTTKEIKSDTLEKLLRALDVKHISGWYHPAMRLQAELHNLEGINAELREQLRIFRMENETLKSGIKIIPETSDDISEGEVIKDGNIKNDVQHTELSPDLADKGDDLLNTFTFEHITASESDTVEIILEKIGTILNEFTGKQTPSNFQNVLNFLKNLLDLLLKIYNKTNSKLIHEIEVEQTKNKKLAETLEVVSSQLVVLTEHETPDSMKSKLKEYTEVDVLNRRKIIFLEDEVNKATKDKDSMSEKYRSNEEKMKTHISDLELKNLELSNKIEVLNNNSKLSIDLELFNETKNSLFILTSKHRKLCDDYEKSNEEWSSQLKLLKETNTTLEKNKQELSDKLISVLAKLHGLDNINIGVDEYVEKLTKKMAECEVKEISERQRADHTNNLYELVKDQLNKSEEKLKDFAKYNESILQKNLVLQEQLKDTEIKLSEFVDNDLYLQLQIKYNNLLEKLKHMELQEQQHINEKKLHKDSITNANIWTTKKEQELLSLKHQIVDLIAKSDEKMLISQLHSDNKYYKMMDLEYNKKIEGLQEELKTYKLKYEDISKVYSQEKEECKDMEVQTRKKISFLENILIQQKIQYLGCIPVTSEEKFIQKIREINKIKHDTFLNLIDTQKVKNDSELLKEQYEYELRNLTEQKNVLGGNKEEYNKMLSWLQEKKTLQLSELRYKRQSEFRESQLQHLIEKNNMQDQEIAQLEEDLLMCHKNLVFNPVPEDNLRKLEVLPSPPRSAQIILTKTEETQTIEIPQDTNVSDESKISNVRAELIQTRNELIEKSNIIDQLKNKITEQDMTLSMFKKQIGDKQSQISFYEKHILELQSKTYDNKDLYNGAGGDNITVGKSVSQVNEELVSLQALVKNLQEALSAKEKAVSEYESLLKEDRDKHSLAAGRLQEEIKILQKTVIEEKQKSNELEENIKQYRPNRAAIDEYVNQVHSLEKHTADLHTSVSSLEAQLQASRQEAVRWRELADDRLQAMNELHKNLDEQHKSELAVYKEDSERWREEVTNLNELISKHRNRAGSIGQDIQKIIKDKDNKIHELTVMLRQAKIESCKSEKSADMNLSQKLIDLESTVEQLQKENDTLRKRYEQLLQRERSVRDETRELKAQLIKKSNIVRTDKSEKQIKDQLQKKINSLEAEIVELKDSLAEQVAINESHKVRTAEDFDRWKKQKYWQQTTDKLKNKLKEKDAELEKIQQTSSGYRLLIDRLEREKHNLENRIKNLKSNASLIPNEGTIEMLRIENMKLMAENQSLTSRLEMSQHHAGGLGAALLQEKLEGQERKIAILEVSAKSPSEVRTEMEKMQNQISTLRKKNLCLEAENIEFKMDLEKSRKEVPHLMEQIQHLESYVEVLKTEKCTQCDVVDKSRDKNVEGKKVSELERTVFILKRVVEKLQVENKRLQGGKRPYCEKTTTGEKLNRDYNRLKDQYMQSIQKVTQLEQELTTCREKIKSFTNKPVSDNVKALSEELSEVRQQLEQKSLLLDKVKLLLQRAAIKEKALLDEIAELKRNH